MEENKPAHLFSSTNQPANRGRKPKHEELAMIERLTPLDDDAFEALRAGIERSDFRYVKLYFQYRFGMPKQITSLGIHIEQPIFEL